MIVNNNSIASSSSSSTTTTTTTPNAMTMSSAGGQSQRVDPEQVLNTLQEDESEVEELNHQIAHAQQQIEVNAMNINEMERAIETCLFEERDVLEMLRKVNGQEATEWLCVSYKMMADLKTETRQLEMEVGVYDDNDDDNQ